MLYTRGDAAFVHVVPPTCTTYLSCRSSASSSSSSSSSSSTDEEYPIFPDGMGAGSDICNFSAYVVDPLFPFDNENRSSETTVELLNKSTWWYTSTRGQDANAASNSTASETGTAVVLLGDPGFYIACLVLGDEDCSAADCLEFQVYQPHYDILQVRYSLHLQKTFNSNST